MLPIQTINETTATVGIIGLGYVGIPLALRTCAVGYKVIGFDINPARCLQINEGRSPIKHISAEAICNLNQSGFKATTNFEHAHSCEVLVICVPTPLNKMREPDLSFVVATMERISPHLREGQLLVLESTTWPGTTREILLPFAERSGLVVGKNFALAYSPEREDPGNKNFTTRTIPKVVGGHTPACLETAAAFYSKIVDQIVPVSSNEVAEMTKLLENIHRSVNIGLVNEIKVVADAMGLDIFEIIDAAKTKPFGFTAYYPGPGIGGHCIPVDPFYLTWKAREYGIHTRFIELAGEINAEMPRYVIEKLVRGLNEVGKSLSGAKVLVLGIAYKKNVDDMRESPSVLVMEQLEEWGADIAYSDPHVPAFPKMREHTFNLTSQPLSAEYLQTFDAVLLLTDHDELDYELIGDNSKLLIDTRGRFAPDRHIIRA